MTKFKTSYLEFVLAGVFPVLLLFKKFTALYIGVIILTVTYSYIKKKIKFHFNRTTFGFILLYLAYILGTFWTQNPKLANFYVVNKLAFILLPFLFAFKKRDGFNINIVLSGLIIATLIAFGKGIIDGLPCYELHHSFPYCFMRSHLSPAIHPTYMTVFAQFSIFAIIKMLQEKWMKKVIGFPLMAVLLLYSILLMSLSGFIFAVLVIMSFLIYKLWQKVNAKVLIFAILTLFIALVFVVLRTPYLKEEIKYSSKAIKNYVSSPSDFVNNLHENYSGSDVRLVMWSVTCQEIASNPLGVGTGNVDIFLGKNLRDKGLNKIADEEYNPHNQFLQTTLEIGFFGGFILLLIFVFGFRDAARTKNWMMFLLFACLLLNCLFESMLQHQSAIIFFPFLYLLMLVDFNSPKAVKE